VKYNHSRLLLVSLMGILFALLSGCSPPAFHVFVVEEIGVQDNIVYVRASQNCNYCDDELLGYVYYASDDQGQNWKEVTTPSNAIVQMLEPDQNKQSSVCLSVDTQICYRIASSQNVELSMDSGATWETDWQIPSGRTYYMQRRSPYLFPDTNLFDIQTIETNTGHSVVVAMGNQGVLVKSTDGAWGRIPVGKATPIPFQAASISEANEVLIYNEGIILVLIAIGFFIVLSVFAWYSLYVKSDAALRRKILWACLPFGISFTIFTCYLLAGFAGIRSVIEALDGLQVLILVLPLLGLFVTWIAIILLISVRVRLGLLTLLATVGLSILSYYFMFFPFQLWALGIIPVYEFARVIVWVVGIAVLFGAMSAETKIAPLVVKQ